MLGSNLKKNGRIVKINGTSVTITDMDYDVAYASVNSAPNIFTIAFEVIVNNKYFLIDFSNGPLESQSPYLPSDFKGKGASYIQFLKEVESSPENQVSGNTESAANNIIGAIAQSVYYDVASHSPDQDEE